MAWKELAPGEHRCQICGNQVRAYFDDPMRIVHNCTPQSDSYINRPFMPWVPPVPRDPHGESDGDCCSPPTQLPPSD